MNWGKKTNIEERYIDPQEDKGEQWDKKIYFGIVLFIVLVFQIIFIVEQPTWQQILILEVVVGVIVAMVGFVWWVISQPLDKKSRILKAIDKEEEISHTQYQQNEKLIDCTAYSAWYDLFEILSAYGLILLTGIDVAGNFSDAPLELRLTLYLMIFFSFIFFPAVRARWKTDKILVDPTNQTFVVRRIVWLFFYSRKKHIFPWTEVEIINAPDLISPEKSLTFNFSPQFQTRFTPGREDYHKIIRKYFMDLRYGDDKRKTRALKALTRYDRHLRKTRRWVHGIALCVALAEIFVLIWFL